MLFPVAGARPKFMKIAPIVRALRARRMAHSANEIEWKMVNSGQRGEPEVMHEPLSFMGEPRPEERIRKLVFTFTSKKDVQFDEPRDSSFHGRWVIEAGGLHE